MRLSILATALTAASFATAQVDIAQSGANADATSSALTTLTLTRTLERVVQTVTATRNDTQLPLTATSVVMPLASASLSITPCINGTASVWGTGAGPTGMPSQTGRRVSGGSRVAVAGVLGAVAGVVGLAVL